MITANKDTFFSPAATLNCGGRILDLREPVVMGILNLTPDSFFDGGKYANETQILHQVGRMLTEGAAIIDTGACSTRPGAAEISEKEELHRLIPALRCIRQQFPETVVSVDTWRAGVAEAAIEEGAVIINDVSGGRLDPEIIAVVGRHQLPYIMGHIQGKPSDMQKDPQYEDVLQEVLRSFVSGIAMLRAQGVKDIILDPGFGFGKTLAHNYELLNKLGTFRMLGLPLLAGISRKSMIGKLLDITPGEALNGTTCLHTIALLNGAGILRVHDVKEAVQAVRLVQYYRQFNTSPDLP